jgi:hypothetical protein
LIGNSILESLTTGDDNTCVGRAICVPAGINQPLTTGSNNVLIGSVVSTTLQGASTSVCIGNNSRFNTDCVAIGHNAIADGPRAIAIGRSAQNFARNCITIGNDIISSISQHINHSIIGNNSSVCLRSDGNGLCDLGSTVNQFKSLFLSGSINGLSIIGGRYSQTSAPITITSVAPATMLGSGVGSLVISSLSAGDNYHFRCSGDVRNDVNNNTVRIIVRLGTIVIHDTSLILLEVTGGTSLYSFELEMDATAKASNNLSSNSQFLYSAGTDTRDLRGSTSNTNSNFDFTVPRAITATAQLGTASAATQIVVNQFLITKTY